MAQRGKNWSWAPEKFKKKLYKQVQKNLDTAAIVLSQDIKDSFGDSGITGGKSGATKQQRAANRSQPWGPPNVDTGHLKRNIGYDRPGGRPLVRRVGTGIGNKNSVGYAVFLEFGTRRMLPRPYLRPMLHRDRKKIRRILSTPVK